MRRGLNIVLLAIMVFISGCSGKPEKSSGHLDREDLERAIEAIEQRRRLEVKIIDEHERQIAVFSENEENSHSKSMKDQYRNKIRVREAGIAKAKHNIANQDSLLIRLHTKLDSIQQVENAQDSY